MRALMLVALLLAHLAHAADDAPVVLKAGDPAPVSGVLLPDAVAVHAAQRQAACTEETAELRKAVMAAPSPALVVVLVVAGVLVGGAAGAAVALSARRP